jgi:ABC-2 type transport system permease protein
MSATCLEVTAAVAPAPVMPGRRLLRAYLVEARYEFLRMMRVLSFSIPFLVLPAGLFLLFGVLMFGDEVRKDPAIGKFILTAFIVMGAMGPGIFAFGASVATEREHGLLRLRRALPAPTGSYIVAKMAMTALFATVVMASMLLAGLFPGHVRLGAGQCLAIAAIGIAGSLPFCAIGLFIGVRSQSKAAMAFCNLIYVPMMHLSGLFYPLPDTLRTIAPVWPSWHLQQLVLRAMGSPSFGNPLVHAAFLVGSSLVLGWISVRRLQSKG